MADYFKHVGSSSSEGSEADYIERITAMTKSLQLKDNTVSVADTGIRLNPWLNTHYKECFFKWIPESKYFDRSEARYYIEKAVTKFKDINPVWDLQELELDPFMILCHKLTKVFLLIVAGDWADATRLLAEAKDNIDTAVEKGFTAQKYQQGFHYLRQGLEAFKLSVMQHDDEQEINLEHYLDSYIRYDDLKDETLPVLKAAKAYFYECIRYSYVTQISLFQELCDEDPDQIFWKIRVYSLMRLRRRESNRSQHPSEDERAILVECLQLDPNFMWVIDAVIQYLIDVATTRCWSEDRGPLRLTDNLEFGNYANIQDYLKSLTGRSDVQTVLGHSVKINLRFAKFVTDLFKHIPQEAQDPELVWMRLRCLTTALEMKPDGSKVNHRVGNFYHTVENKLDVALVFYRKAYEADPRNYPALIELIKSLMRDIKGNEEELEALFENSMKEEHWNDNRRADLHFEFGLFRFMQEKYWDCMDAWETAFMLKPEVMGNVQFLFSQSRRYRWNSRLIDVAKMKGLFENAKSKSESGKIVKTEVLEFAKAGLDHLQQVVEKQRGFKIANRGRENNRGKQTLRQNNDNNRPSIENNWRNRKDNGDDGTGTGGDGGGYTKRSPGFNDNAGTDYPRRNNGGNFRRNGNGRNGNGGRGNNYRNENTFDDSINGNWRA